MVKDKGTERVEVTSSSSKHAPDFAIGIFTSPLVGASWYGSNNPHRLKFKARHPSPFCCFIQNHYPAPLPFCPISLSPNPKGTCTFPTLVPSITVISCFGAYTSETTPSNPLRAFNKMDATPVSTGSPSTLSGDDFRYTIHGDYFAAHMVLSL